MDKMRASRVRGLLKDLQPTTITIGVMSPAGAPGAEEDDDLFADAEQAEAAKRKKKKPAKPSDEIELDEDELDYEAPASTT